MHSTHSVEMLLLFFRLFAEICAYFSSAQNENEKKMNENNMSMT